jgi:hypothetical protein
MWLELWTWVSIGILLFGAPLVFLWFLRDARKLLQGLGQSESANTGTQSESEDRLP